MQYFGERLKNLRIENQMTQKEVAERIGLVSGSISAYEQGKKFPSVEVLIQLCNLFHVSSDYLLGLSDSMDLMKSNLTDRQIILIQQLIRELENNT